MLRIAPLFLAVSYLVGCSSSTPQGLVQYVQTDELGQARAVLQAKPVTDPKDHSYLLQKMRAGIVTLADGYAYAQDDSMNQIFEVLRTQGINKDRTVAAWVSDETQLWKGEPFEQALAFHYIACHYGMLGDWGNARAAAMGSLFPLRNFGKKQDGTPLTRQDIYNNPALWDKDNKMKEGVGYTVVQTNFALGYVMTGIANQQMARESGDANRLAEARDNFQKALSINPHLEPLISILQNNDYNTLLVVDYGKGPEKFNFGDDKIFTDFKEVSASGSEPLICAMGGRSGEVPQVCDVNEMAKDHQWRNLEELRHAKSVLGKAAQVGGAAVLANGAANQSTDEMLVGVGLLAIGTAMRASAAASVDYCEVMPQRVYVVPVNIDHPNTTIELAVANIATSKLVLTGLQPPRGKAAQLRNIRLPMPVTVKPQNGNQVLATIGPWVTSGQIMYGNDYANAGTIKLPYILGGYDVSTPTLDALKRYQSAGFLTGMTVDQLQALYRAEGITWTIQGQKNGPGLHVLEGGNSLLTPLPGTVGYTRLVGQSHPPYKPKSHEVQELAAKLAPQLSGQLVSTQNPSAQGAFVKPVSSK